MPLVSNLNSVLSIGIGSVTGLLEDRLNSGKKSGKNRGGEKWSGAPERGHDFCRAPR